jgi:hypothetical protein
MDLYVFFFLQISKNLIVSLINSGETKHVTWVQLVFSFSRLIKKTNKNLGIG